MIPEIGKMYTVPWFLELCPSLDSSQRSFRTCPGPSGDQLVVVLATKPPYSYHSLQVYEPKYHAVKLLSETGIAGWAFFTTKELSQFRPV